MAYKGSTELSSDANPPRCLTAGMWGQRSSELFSSTIVNGQNLWLYNSTDSSTDFATANFFTDAKELGMREGDMMQGAYTTGSSARWYRGIVSSVTTAGAALISIGNTT